MGMSATDKIFDREALDWLVQVNDPDFDQWEAWDVWMAADPRHAEIYWRLAADEAEAVEALKAAPVRAPSPLRRQKASGFPRRALFGVAAALAVVVVGGVWFTTQQAQPWTVETAPGEQRTITLTDGSTVSLDGATRLAMDRRNPRGARLESGRALFHVVHDDKKPFIVDVDGANLTDLGTIFDVTRLEDGVRVAVSEGSVRIDHRAKSETLNPGDSVLASSRGMERRTLPTDDVAGWQEGRLTYADEALSVVAQDLARALNRPISVAPALGYRRFSGSLTTRSAPDDQKDRLSRLLGVSIVDEGAGWRLEPRPSP